MASRKDSQEPLKAIVFADSCAPSPPGGFKTDRLLNIPILSWQLAALSRFGVKQAIVLSYNPLPFIAPDPLHRLKITPLSSPGWAGEGDALRDLETRDGLRPVDDFLLVRRGAIFNLDVSALVAAHKRRRALDRDWLITAVARRCAGSAATGLVLTVDRASGTLLSYRDTPPEHGLPVNVATSATSLARGALLDVYTDVLDIGLDVCAPEFLVEFRENFYFDTVRAFVREKLDGGDAEVFGNRMYLHFTDSARGEFASRVTNLASLAQASLDVLNGWMVPISTNQMVLEVQASLPATTSTGFFEDRVAMSPDVQIGIGTTLVECVIGKNVKIGSDVTMSHCIIGDGVEIGDRCELERSIFASGCRVLPDCVVPRNCYVDNEVILGSRHQPLYPYSFVTLRDHDEFMPHCDDEDDEDAEKGWEDGWGEVEEGAHEKPDRKENGDLSKGKCHGEQEELIHSAKGNAIGNGVFGSADEDEASKEAVSAAEGTGCDEVSTDVPTPKPSALDSEVSEANENGCENGDSMEKEEHGHSLTTEEKLGDTVEPSAPADGLTAEIADTFQGRKLVTPDPDADFIRVSGGVEEEVFGEDEEDNDDDGDDDDDDDENDDVDEEGIGEIIDARIASDVDTFFVDRNILALDFDTEEDDPIEAPEEVEGEGNNADGEGEVDELADGLQQVAVSDDAVEGEEAENLKAFDEEILETIERAFKEAVELDNTTLEINSLKMAYHTSFAETMAGVVAGISLNVLKASSDQTLYANIVASVQKYELLIGKFNREEDISHHMQVAAGVARQLAENGMLVMYVFKAMYEENLLEEHGILAWAAEEEKRVSDGKSDGSLLTTVRPLMEWLEATDDDEEES